MAAAELKKATPSGRLCRTAAIDGGDADVNADVDAAADANAGCDVNDDADDDERWQPNVLNATTATLDSRQTKTTATKITTTIAKYQNNKRNTTTTAATTTTKTSQRFAPRASFPEIMQPRLSLNGMLNPPYPSLMPSPRPLYRDHSSRSINPLTAYEQQMAELDGSFYGSNAAYLGAGMSGSAGGATTCTNLTVGGAATAASAAAGCGGGGGGGVGSGAASGGGGGGGVGGGGAGAFHTTELSITPTMPADEQFIDLGSLRRFSIDRQSFLGKTAVCLCVCVCVLLLCALYTLCPIISSISNPFNSNFSSLLQI